MNVTLKPDLERFLQDEVRSGRFASMDDAVNAAVALLQTDRDSGGWDVDELRAEVDVGIAEADRGEFVQFTAEDVIQQRNADWQAKRGKTP